MLFIINRIINHTNLIIETNENTILHDVTDDNWNFKKSK